VSAIFPVYTRSIAAEQRQLSSEAQAFASGRGPAPDMLSSPPEVLKDGLIDIIDKPNTWSELNLNSVGDAYAFTHTFFPAQIKQHATGTVTVGGTPWTIDHEDGTGSLFATGYYGQFYVDPVQCWSAPAQGNITTTHSADAKLFDLGFHLQTYDTYASSSCDPQHMPCYTMPGLTGGGHIIPPGDVDNHPAYSESYDPYAEDGPDTGTCTGSGGGGDGTASGAQYHPGDSTGGETVSWGTGQGNGGSSACGAAAIVEFVCIEQWTSSGWEIWGCGYVTTC
jgi:hypothetical protein